jgi:adenine-specific DNA methylase
VINHAFIDETEVQKAKVPTCRTSQDLGAPATGTLEVDAQPVVRSPLRHLDAEDISARVRREVRNREVHLPPISIYRWWARRTESVNGAVIDAVNVDRPGRLVVSDPFAGGGVIPLAAVMRGHSVYAQDLNSWAAGGLAAMLALPDADALRTGIAALSQRVLPEAAAAYGTVLSDGTVGQVSHTFRVAVGACTHCGERQRLFPHALVSLLSRVERNRPEAFLACPKGHLFQGRRDQPKACPTCNTHTSPEAIYTPRRVVTCHCGQQERLEARAVDGLDWEVVLVERVGNGRRELALPTAGELSAADGMHWKPTRSLGPIPAGQETAVLLRHGFRHWEDIYPRRQRALVERLLGLTAECSSDERVVAALRLAVVGSTEMAGLLSRWDRYYLKSYESMAGHRFNFTTLPVEPNAWGTVTSGRGTTLRRLVQLVKAAEWLQSRTTRTLKVQGPLPAAAATVPPLDGEDVDGRPLERPDVLVVAGSSQRQLLPSCSVDLVLTDPPYHDDVQYGELSQPLQAWAGLPSQDVTGDAVVNRATGQLVAEGSYTGLLTAIFRESTRLLRADGHLVFSYANRDPDAWAQLFDALQRAGLRSAGCAVVHSENETDHAKRGVRACTLDLLLDLVPVSALPLVQHHPSIATGAEAEFLSVVTSYALQIGTLKPGWQHEFLNEATATEFLQPQRRKRLAKGIREKQRRAVSDSGSV